MADPRDEMIERLLRDAGIGAGKRVLDVGCGQGSVTCLLAGLVGTTGSVLGIDRDAAPLSAARQRARELGYAHISFEQHELAALPDRLGQFDAAVGRRVWMYVPDPLAALRSVHKFLRPGGCIVIQEHDATMVPGRTVPLALHERVHTWIWQTVAREGANTHIGFDLPQLLEEAGFVVEHVRAEAVVQTPTTDYPLAAIVRAMLPRIVQHAVATAEEIDIESLAQRLDAERRAAKSIYVSDLVFGVWARKAS